MSAAPREITADDEKVIHRCAWSASKHLCPGLAREDLKQEGRIALLLAKRDGRVDAITDPVHRQKYIARRVLGAMLDANRAAWRQQPMYVDEITDSTPMQLGWHQPDQVLEFRQASDYLRRRASPQLMEALDLLSTGEAPVDVARTMGLHPSRISIFRATARNLVDRCLTLTP